MKIVFTVFIALLIVGTGAYPQEMAANRQSPVEKLAAFAVDEQLNVNNWTVTIKEPVDQKSSDRLQKEALSFFNQADLTKEENINATKVIIKNSQRNEKIVEYIILIVPKSEYGQAEMVYSMKGQGTTSLTEEKMRRINDVKSRFFSKNVAIFSCIKAKSSGIINDVLVYEKFRQAFNVVTIDEVIENGWNSRSGYTEEWEQAIPLASDQMNIQFASRTLGGETNITIGTPIITAEY